MSSSSSSLSSLSSESSISSLSSESSISSLSSDSSISSLSSESSSSFDIQNASISEITGGNVISKATGNKNSYINAVVVKQIPLVSQDPLFSSDTNWERVIVLYTNSTGQQKAITHKHRNNQWHGVLKISSSLALGDWIKKRILIRDMNGAILSLNRELIGTDEDLSVTE